MANILDISSWVEGSGSCTGFTCNGDVDENWREYDTNPWGSSIIIWKSQSNALAYGADGGWNGTLFDIDNTRMYRWSVWINRKILGTKGRIYFGTRAYNGGTSTSIGALDGTVYGSNPYFWSSANPPSAIDPDTWYLYVGHVWPLGTNFGDSEVYHSDSGIWKMDGTKQENIFRDYVWLADNNKSNHRTYLHYCQPDTTQEQWWCYPRVDLIDGTEPKIKNLINNSEYYINFKIGSNAIGIRLKDVLSN